MSYLEQLGFNQLGQHKIVDSATLDDSRVKSEMMKGELTAQATSPRSKLRGKRNRTDKQASIDRSNCDPDVDVVAHGQ